MHPKPAKRLKSEMIGAEALHVQTASNNRSDLDNLHGERTPAKNVRHRRDSGIMQQQVIQLQLGAECVLPPPNNDAIDENTHPELPAA